MLGWNEEARENRLLDFKVHECFGNDISGWKNEDGTYAQHVFTKNVPYYSADYTILHRLLFAFQERGGVDIFAHGNKPHKFFTVESCTNDGKMFKHSEKSLPLALSKVFAEFIPHYDEVEKVRKT